MKDFSEIKHQIDSISQELERFRLKKLRNSHIRLVIFVLLLIPVLDIDYIAVTEIGSLPFLDILIFCVPIIFLFFFVYLNDNEMQYQEQFKEKLFAPMVQMINPTLNYQPAAFIGEEPILAAELFPAFNSLTKKLRRVEGEDLFEGKKGNTNFQFSEVKIGRERYFGKGLYGFDKVFFKGLFMVLENKTNLHQEFFIKPKLTKKSGKVIDPPFPEKTALDLDLLPKVKEQFWVYGKDAKQKIPTKIIEQINHLQRLWGTPIHIHFNNAHIYIALSFGKQTLFTPKLNKSIINSPAIEQLYKELARCFQTIDDFTQNDAQHL